MHSLVLPFNLEYTAHNLFSTKGPHSFLREHQPFDSFILMLFLTLLTQLCALGPLGVFQLGINKNTDNKNT